LEEEQKFVVVRLRLQFDLNMSVPEYEDRGPVDCTVEPDLSRLKGKSVIVTGGVSGIGKAYTDAFIAAGAYVTVGDIDVAGGEKLAKEHEGKVQFCKCDVVNWEDQVAMFKAAVANSPSKSCDVVIANAGVGGHDDLAKLDDPNEEPVKPSLKTLDINLLAVTYTAKLAIHFFRRQAVREDRDRCLILQSSLAGYLDLVGSPLYNASKYGVRGLMVSLRRIVFKENIRVNLIGPWFIHTPIMSEQLVERVEASGVKFATVEDAARAAMRIAADNTMNGRALAIVARHIAKSGYIDAAHDDYAEGDFLKTLQDDVMKVAGGKIAIS